MSDNSQAKQNEFAAHFYDEINNVMGGTNPNEKLCLLLPGIALTKSDFEYDYKNSAAKGPVIEANESRLANKLYDPMDMVGGDNGKTLEHQYRSALDMLTPKVNPIIAEAKNELRKLLMKPFPYKFAPKNIMKAEILKSRENSDNTIEYYFENAPADKAEADSDEAKTYTFQEVFFRLYNEYVEQLGEWANERQRRKDFYIKRAEKITDEKQRNKKAENDYLQWYEDNGQTWLTAVNQKMSVLLSIFSATDMKIVEGILDCGSGAELQEARQTLNNTKNINPDGGYIYPVKFNPTNWFEYLDTSFTPVDLLNTPTAILDELKLLYNRRDYICSRITDIAAEVKTNDATIDAKRKAVDEAKATYIKDDDALQNAMEDTFGDFAKFITKAICSACSPATEAAPEVGSTQRTNITDKIVDAVSTSAGQKQEDADSKVKGIFEAIEDIQKAPFNIQIPTNISNCITPVSKIFEKTTDKNGKESSCRPAAITSLEKITSTEISTLTSSISSKLSNYTATIIGNDENKQKEKDTLSTAITSVSELSRAIDNVKNTKTKDEAKNELKTTDVSKDKTELANSLKEARSTLSIADTINNGIDIIFEGSRKVNDAQSKYVNSISDYTTALGRLQSAENLDNFKLQLKNLEIDQKNVDSKIRVLEAKLSQVSNYEQCFSDSTTPPVVPEGFTQFNIVHTVTDTSSSSYEHETSITKSETKGFWCFKTKKRSVETTSSITKLCSSTGSEIEIGMNVAKVGIEREWFNPGIFALTGEMYNVAEKTQEEIEAEVTEANKVETAKHSNKTITIDDIEPVLRISHGIGKGTASDMETLSHDVFPCYPTSMIIARDVTIKVTTTSSSDSASMYSATRDVANSSAFFVFNAGNGSHAHTSCGSARSRSSSRAVTIRFNTPQIIGFFLQIIPKDVSAKYPGGSNSDENNIVKFVQAYENVIKERLDAESADSQVINEEENAG